MPFDLPGIDVYENNRANCVPVCSGICYVHVRSAGCWSRRLSSMAAVRSGKFIWWKSILTAGRFRCRLSAVLCDSRRLPCLWSITPRMRPCILQQHELCLRKFPASISLSRPGISLLCRRSNVWRALLLGQARISGARQMAEARGH